MIEHLEPIVRATETHLRARLPAHVATVNAEMLALGREEPVIAAPADDAYYAGGWTVLKYPSIEFAAPDFELLNLPQHRQDADGGTSIALRGWVEDARTEPGRLYFRALRFGTAILRTLMEWDPQGTTPAGILMPFGPNARLSPDRPVRGAYRFNPETEQRDELTGAIVLVFRLETIETLS